MGKGSPGCHDGYQVHGWDRRAGALLVVTDHEELNLLGRTYLTVWHVHARVLQIACAEMRGSPDQGLLGKAGLGVAIPAFLAVTLCSFSCISPCDTQSCSIP